MFVGYDGSVAMLQARECYHVRGSMGLSLLTSLSISVPWSRPWTSGHSSQLVFSTFSSLFSALAALSGPAQGGRGVGVVFV